MVEQPPIVSNGYECDPSFDQDVMACREILNQSRTLVPGCMKAMLTRTLPQISDTDIAQVERICCAAFVAAAWTMRQHDERKEEASSRMSEKRSDAVCNLSAFVDRYAKVHEPANRDHQ